MKVNEALRRINFKIGNMDDITGKSVNPIIDNRYVVDELNTQLRQYANITKGIQDIYSFSLQTKTPFVEAPILALRSQSYYAISVLYNGTMYSADMRSPREVLPNFPVNPVQGITNWFMPFNAGNKAYFGAYPMNSTAPKTTNLTKNITSEDTIISVTSTAGFINNNGRLTIGSEKIHFKYKDLTNFYGCERGVEMTNPVSHENNEIVNENNVIMYYARMAMPIIVRDDNFIEKAILDRDIEVVEEHMEGIIKAVAYNLIIKIDPDRANFYKVDADALYEQYRIDISKGYFRGRSGTNTRNPYYSESGVPYATNLMY